MRIILERSSFFSFTFINTSTSNSKCQITDFLMKFIYWAKKIKFVENLIGELEKLFLGLKWKSWYCWFVKSMLCNHNSWIYYVYLCILSTVTVYPKYILSYLILSSYSTCLCPKNGGPGGADSFNVILVAHGEKDKE